MFLLVSSAGGLPPSCSVHLPRSSTGVRPLLRCGLCPSFSPSPRVSYNTENSSRFVDSVGGFYLFSSSTWVPGIRAAAPSVVITTCTHDDRGVPPSRTSVTALPAAGHRRAGEASLAGVGPRGEVVPFRSILHSMRSSCSVKQHRWPNRAYTVLLRRLRSLHQSRP